MNLQDEKFTRMRPNRFRPGKMFVWVNICYNNIVNLREIEGEITNDKKIYGYGYNFKFNILECFSLF